MNYVIAAYGLTIGTLLIYLVMLQRERRRLSRERRGRG
ncbi:MAG TPA: heme exporter protein CcmD [Myxococcota bacterium]